MCALAVSSLAALVTLPIAYVGNGQIREGGVISSGAFTPWAEIRRVDEWEGGISITVVGVARGLSETTVELPCDPVIRDHAMTLIRGRMEGAAGKDLM